MKRHQFKNMKIYEMKVTNNIVKKITKYNDTLQDKT